MVDIEIFLIFNGGQIPLLSIPRSDVERLAVSPFRWIRYVMFTICGARGNLSATLDPDGPSVDYDRTELADAENTYYYRPSENCVFVDPEGLNDPLTSTARTPRRNNFRAGVIRRDGHACVVSAEPEADCDAAHLIPRSKGQEYIARVVELRSSGDGSPPPSNVEIDDIVNGIFLRKDLHSSLGRGAVAFIKTPNYGLRPEDIRKFQQCDSRPEYITLHRMKKHPQYNPTSLGALQQLGAGPSVALALGANVDALFQGKGGSPPSTVILDYVYGVAAYKSWRSKRGDVSSVVDDFRKEHYADIPPLPPRPPDDSEDESDLAKAMDELNVFLMHIHGITPEEAAKRRQKKIEQEEWAAQEASRIKVMEWRKHAVV